MKSATLCLAAALGANPYLVTNKWLQPQKIGLVKVSDVSLDQIFYWLGGV